MKHFLSALVIVMIVIPAKGEEVTFSFRGTVHELDGEFNYFTGHPFEITYTFESTTDDADPNDPESGSYIGAFKSGSLTISPLSGSIRWVVKSDGSINFIEVKNLDTADSYSASASVSGPAVGGEIPAHFLIELKDKNASALGDDRLPSSLDMASFDSHRIVRFTFVGADKLAYSTIGIITSGDTPAPHSDTD